MVTFESAVASTNVEKGMSVSFVSLFQWQPKVELIELF